MARKGRINWIWSNQEEIIRIRVEISEVEHRKQIDKIKENLFEGINKFDKPLAWSTKERREKTQINKNQELQRECHKQSYKRAIVHQQIRQPRWNGEISRKPKLPKLIQKLKKKKENLNRPLTGRDLISNENISYQKKLQAQIFSLIYFTKYLKN